MAHPPLAMLMAALSENGYAQHDSSTLEEIIGCSSQDAQYSKQAAEHVGILKRFQALGKFTVRELKLLSSQSRLNPDIYGVGFN